MMSPARQTRILQLLSIALGAGIWMAPVPDGLQPAAWHLFAIFAAAIFAVVSAATSILVASIVALVVSIFSGTLEPTVAYSGFSQGFILLIVVAFLVGKGVVNSGLGMRIACLLVRAFGRTSLGLAYSMVATDAIIAPAFPSSTARSGVLFRIVESLALSGSSSPHDAMRTKFGAFLVMSTMASIGLSSGLWIAAMAANPIGLALASRFGVEPNFASWLLAAVTGKSSIPG
ncbi:MAG: anion permease [Gammaproteobacteria bacterium]|nr:anion permease [Gammaproteobacteria bacterium]MDH4316352.1 anion permease [Gammaproteobacteria bacterium]MDH5215481.1 anion permease [Gammaproteobacteria bacterium]